MPMRSERVRVGGFNPRSPALPARVARPSAIEACGPGLLAQPIPPRRYFAALRAARISAACALLKPRSAAIASKTAGRGFVLPSSQL